MKDEGFKLDIPDGWEAIPNYELLYYRGEKGKGIKYGVRNKKSTWNVPYKYPFIVIKIIEDSEQGVNFLELEDPLTIDEIIKIRPPNFTSLEKEILDKYYVDLGREILWIMYRKDNNGVRNIELTARVYKEQRIIIVRGSCIDSRFNQFSGNFVSIIKSIRKIRLTDH